MGPLVCSLCFSCDGPTREQVDLACRRCTTTAQKAETTASFSELSICLFLFGVLGLRCCAGFSLAAESRASPLVALQRAGPPLSWRCREQGLPSRGVLASHCCGTSWCREQALGLTGLSSHGTQAQRLRLLGSNLCLLP